MTNTGSVSYLLATTLLICTNCYVQQVLVFELAGLQVYEMVTPADTGQELPVD